MAKYRIPVNWSTPYDKIFNFKTFDFGHISTLDKNIWDRINANLPGTYSILDRPFTEYIFKQIGVPMKSQAVIDAEYQKVTPKKNR